VTHRAELNISLLKN